MTKQNKTNENEIQEKTILASLDGLLSDYVKAKAKTTPILQEIANTFLVLHKWNNIGACKKIIKTLTTERNAFCRYLARNGLLIVWNVKTDDLAIGTMQDYTGKLEQTFENFLKDERKINAEKKVQELQDLTVFKKEYEKKVQTLFANLNENQKQVLKELVKKY